MAPAVPFELELELERVRGAGEVVREGLRIWFRQPGPFLMIGAAIAVPAELIVPGLVGGRLFSAFDPDAPITAGAAGPTSMVFALWVTPATWTACATLLMSLASGSRPRAREALDSTFERVGDTLFPVLLAGLGSAFGLVLLVAPGVYLYVRWYLTVQTIVVEGVRGVDSLDRSSELVAGRWWPTFGRVVLITVVCSLPFLAFILLGQLAGSVTRYEASALLGEAIGDIFFFPLMGIMSTLVYFDLRARQIGPPGGHPSLPPPGANSSP